MDFEFAYGSGPSPPRARVEQNADDFSGSE
jgi:hypothetical protein